MADATCASCPLWTRTTQPRFQRDPDPNTGEPVSDGREPAKYGYCHRASLSDEFRPNEDWFCSEHPLLQRDRLAAMAMQAVLANPSSVEVSDDEVADAAYAAADAMIAKLRLDADTATPTPEKTP